MNVLYIYLIQTNKKYFPIWKILYIFLYNRRVIYLLHMLNHDCITNLIDMLNLMI